MAVSGGFDLRDAVGNCQQRHAAEDVLRRVARILLAR